MYQQPRPTSSSAATPNSPQRHHPRVTPTRTYSSSDMSSTNQGVRSSEGKEQTLRDRLNLIILHFFTKCALVICASRVTLPPAIGKNGEAKVDRWFNTLVEETDALNQDLQDWKSMDATVERPTPLVIDVYLDLAQLAANQTLVALDQDGKPWDVSETLNSLNAAAPSPQNQAMSRLVYERWTISLDDASTVPSAQLTDVAPNFYKKGVITCRALCTYARLLPAWRLSRRLGRQAANGPPTLRPRYRVSDPSLAEKSQPDSLNCALFPSDKRPTETYRFAPVHCSLGSLNISVTYRKNLDLHVELSEQLISARMAGREHISQDRPDSRLSRGSSRERSSIDQDREASRGQIPRFSSSFKRSSIRSNPLGTSPRLGSFRESGDRPYSAQASEDSGTLAQSQGQGSLRWAKQESRPTPSLIQREREGARPSSSPSKDLNVNPFQRRPSVSFQPFKAGSLSSSPATGNYLSQSPGSSIGRSTTTPLLTHNRKSSLTTLPQQALRNPGFPNETAVGSSASSSPKPAPIQRYSSSFSNRRSRFPSVSSSRVDEDNVSSGRASVSSGNRGSSTLQEGEGASSGSVQTDEENIADFLKLLDKNKGLPSFNKTDKASLTANSQRTAAQYSKFSRMKDSNTQLSDSMASSLMLQRSSSSSSRNLHNMPGMVPGSLSTSSSPGKPISPHTPHMPAIPSRLSNNSIIADYSRDRSRSRVSTEATEPQSDRVATRGDTSTRGGHGTPLSTAIDIPTSPRTFPAGRRSSSVAQSGRVRGVDLEETDFGLRSASMPAEDRGELSLSELLMQTESGGSVRRRREVAAAAADDDEPLLFALAD